MAANIGAQIPKISTEMLELVKFMRALKAVRILTNESEPIIYLLIFVHVLQITTPYKERAKDFKNPLTLYHPTTIEQLQSKYPFVSWVISKIVGSIKLILNFF